MRPAIVQSGHEPDDTPCKDHQHTFWWPVDDDNDGFIDHVMVWAPGSFEQYEIDALRRMTRLHQRGRRPDLLITPTYVGLGDNFPLWERDSGSRVFVSATPYFCPVHLSHGRGKSGRIRSLRAEIIKGLQLLGVIHAEDEVEEIKEIVFDYSHGELTSVVEALKARRIAEPVPPRQYFPVIDAPNVFPPLPQPIVTLDARHLGATLKDADAGYCFGSATGLLVNGGSRFVRTLSFCRRRRNHKLHGRGRMLHITFSEPRKPRPFAIGSQCHFGLGQFVPSNKAEI